MSQIPARLCAKGDDCAILFARTPAPGRVKSRMWTHFTKEEACRLHCASTNDTLALLGRALPGASRWLFLSEEPEAAEPTVSAKPLGLDVPSGFGCAVQEGNGLGERMGAAFQRAFDSGARRVVIFGSDSPTLPAAVVQQAFKRLADVNDLVLGPTEDGGYYLIGCRRFERGLFQGVEWSTPRVFAATCANAERLGYRVAVLEKWFDLDEWKDVERVMEDARRGVPLPEHLAALLQELNRNR
jgi:rSAM/selenodomain-associated transferase 1